LLTQPDPKTVNGILVNERARLAAHKALEVALDELSKPIINVEKLHGLAAVIESCANDWDIDSSDE
jgi:hypothetical protein